MQHTAAIAFSTTVMFRKEQQSQGTKRRLLPFGQHVLKVESITLLLLCCLLSTLHYNVCNAYEEEHSYCVNSEDPGSCQNNDSTDYQKCNLSPTLCNDISTSGLYHRGTGTAMAYKPNQPFKEEVCQNTSTNMRYKAATWPYYRSSKNKSPPQITLTLNLWTCRKQQNEENDDSTKTCCCQPINHDESKSSSFTVDVWQTRPDGTYSSLRPGVQDGDCRARQTIINNFVDDASSTTTNSVVFTTIAPGSTGIFNGLGPNGWDLSPYGPPVIHILVSADTFQDLLLDIPFLLDQTTLDEREFWGPDYRGPAWMGNNGPKTNKKLQLYKTKSWTVYSDQNHIEVELDIFLQKSSLGAGLKKTNRSSSPVDKFCESSLYGLPSSFFLEPISICAPSILNFFPL